jgi:hypothetical protein
VLDLFAATGKTFKDDAERDTAVKPYLAMDEETFAAVAADFKSLKPAPRHDSRLFSVQATRCCGGRESAGDPNDLGQNASRSSMRRSASPRSNRYL